MLLEQAWGRFWQPACVCCLPSAWNASPADLQVLSILHPPSDASHPNPLLRPPSSRCSEPWLCFQQKPRVLLTLDISVVNPGWRHGASCFPRCCILCAETASTSSVSTRCAFSFYSRAVACGALLTLFPPVLTEIMDEVMIIIGSG